MTLCLGYFLFSSFISATDNLSLIPIISSSPEARLSPPSPSNPTVPFTIGARMNSKVFINNHLILSNYWITQGANAQIIMDIILQTLQRFPTVSQPSSQ